MDPYHVHFASQASTIPAYVPSSASSPSTTGTSESTIFYVPPSPQFEERQLDPDTHTHHRRTRHRCHASRRSTRSHTRVHRQRSPKVEIISTRPPPYIIPTRGARPQVHQALQFSTTPLIQYDVSLLPSTATAVSDRTTPIYLNEPATDPPRSSITLISPFLIWRIKIHSSSSSSSTRHGYRRHITLSDVFTGLHRALRTHVLPHEFLSLTPRDSKRIASAYKRRYRRIYDATAREVEKQGGLRRVDFLAGCTLFTGLSPPCVQSEPGVWTANFA